MRHLTFILMSFLALSEALAQAPVKTTFVSGSGRGGQEGPAMICDDQLSTKWCIDFPRLMPYSIVLDAGQQTSIVEYGLVTGDDTNAYPERNPVTWSVSGSNDKENWTTIDEQKNNRSLPAEGLQEYRFKPKAAGAKGKFRYYRFEFSKMAGGTRIQLSEIYLYDKVQMPVKATFVSGSGRDGKEGAAMAADGWLFTKWCIDEPRQMPYSIILDAGEAATVTEYRFVTGDDTHDYPDRNPVSWKMSGSNDQKSWTVLDEQKGNRLLRDENEQEYRFRPATSGNYRYYRFEFLKMAGGTRLQLSEIKLFK
ncbi:MAG: discoidin domain-containing protein [Bacteroidaceae bacterium]|nr:discoidin domain-containing protein [Bacteroidaceae bacterium]